MSCRQALVQVKVAATAKSVSSDTTPAWKTSLKKVGPILAASFCAAAIMYPLDLVRSLQMADAGSAVKQTTLQLLGRDTIVVYIIPPERTHLYIRLYTQIISGKYMDFLDFSLKDLLLSSHDLLGCAS
jgi:hypothetical protein